MADAPASPLVATDCEGIWCPYCTTPSDAEHCTGCVGNAHDGDAKMKILPVACLLVMVLLHGAFADSLTTNTRELSLFLGTAPAVVHDFGPGFRYYAIDTLTGRFDADPHQLRVTARAITFQAPGVDIICPIDVTTYRETERLHDVLTTDPPGKRRRREVVTWQTRRYQFETCRLTTAAGTQQMAGRYFGARATTTGGAP